MQVGLDNFRNINLMISGLLFTYSTWPNYCLLLTLPKSQTTKEENIFELPCNLLFTRNQAAYRGIN